MNKIIALFFLMLTVFPAFSQGQPEMADTMRQDGKIYVVILVLSIVFACLATYLIVIDRKLKKLEDRTKA